MDIKILRNYVEIVDSGSLTAASKKLFIAQPALSNQLKALEKEMNTTLIQRNSRHQKLTDAGQLFYERARSIILLEDAMVREVNDTRSGDVGSLRIATIPSGEMTLLQDIFPRFAQEFPQVTYEIHEKESDVIVKLLEDGKVDIGLVRTPCRITSEMETFFIGDERLVFVYNPELFRFDTDRDEIRASELGNMPILVIRKYMDMFLELCARETFTPNIRYTNSQLSITLNWAEAGLGIAILPEDMLSYCSKKMRYKYPADRMMNTKRALLTMKDAFHSKAVKNFLKICHETL